MNLHHINIGTAGELRVMSELLLRGINSARPILDNGSDLILINGIRIQVKTSEKRIWRGKTFIYKFSLGKGGEKQAIKFSDHVDYIITWGIEDNYFWIIPAETLDFKISLSIANPNVGNSKYEKFLNNWELLSKGGEL